MNRSKREIRIILLIEFIIASILLILGAYVFHYSYSRFLIGESSMLLMLLTFAAYDVFMVVYPTILIPFIQELKYKKIYKFSIKEINYFREKLSNVSPGIINVMTDEGVNIEDRMVATLLSLKLKNQIKLVDSQIQVVTDPNINKKEMTDDEKFFLYNYEKIFMGDVELTKSWDKIIQSDLTNKELIEYIEPIKYKETLARTKSGTISGVSLILIFAMLGLIAAKLDVIYIDILFILYLFTLLPTVIKSSKKTSVNIIQNLYCNKYTQKGREIHLKIKGLKMFLENFSTLNDKSKDELLLWDDYLIYTVCFNIKGNLDKETIELYDYWKKCINEKNKS